jgi:glycosyltransferase involved in cell wall biosynthesis
MSNSDAGSRSPRFSIVVATYNVAPYLGEFIDSIEGQTFPLDRLQVIAVDDGSTDDSGAILEAWQRRRPELVTVVSKENGGPASARNAGLPHVRGEWVTFTDPDDVLDTGYLAEVDDYLSKRPNIATVATNRAPFSGQTRLALTNPLRRHFVAGVNRLRNLDIDSGHFHGHAASTFFRTDEIRRGNLRFDERLRVTFEDGHFCCIYLLHVAQPTVAYLPDAVYHYRKRGDGTSQLDRSWADPGRFTDVLEYGYLALLRQGAERYGRAPTWLQGMVLYELSWYLKMNERLSAPTAAHGETAVRYHELMAQMCALLDRPGIETYRATKFPAVWREMLEHGYRDETWHTPYAVVDRLDNLQKLMRVTYRFTGEPPDENFTVYSRVVEPVHEKVRDIRLYDRTLLHERIVWLPLGTVRVVLDGQNVEVRTTDQKPREFRLTAPMIRKELSRDQENGAAEKVDSELSASDRVVLRLARSRYVRWFFRDAWVLIDRAFNADDSAEHLYRYLLANRPDVNAWFVIERGTPDYKRLRRDGFRRRVIAHGSLAWKLLMLNAVQLVSSHIDEVVVRPKEIRRLADPQWRIAFLQHGVIKDDLSTWLNRKNIDVFVTSTPAEMRSIVDDHTTYRYTTREVKLTGLPRFDRLLEEGKRFPPDKRDLILIAPTWRQWLSESEPVFTGRHSVRDEEFRSSEYAREWSAVVNSRELAELAERTGLTVATLLHPNFQGAAQLETPRHVRHLSFEGQNVQETFARARVLVTDYSSMFFNAAYLERPVVYFQFDRERVNAGWHLGRHGYFDYARDGYGPVTLTADEAIAAITKTVESGPDPEPEYLERIRESFPERDGRCCERVVDAIIESMGPAPLVGRPSFRAALVGRVRGVGRRAVDVVRRPAS